MYHSTPGLPVINQLLEFTQTHVIESVMTSNDLILCYPLLLLPSVFPSIGIFSNESARLIRWPKYRSFSFNINPSNEHSGLVYFRMDWLDLLQAKGLLRVFSNITVQKHWFFSVQPSLWSNTHTHTWLLEKPCLSLYGPLLVKQCLCYTRHKNQEKEDWSVPGNQNYTYKGPSVNWG